MIIIFGILIALVANTYEKYNVFPTLYLTANVGFEDDHKIDINDPMHLVLI